MYSEMMYQYGSQRSVIREIFAYGQEKIRELGPDAVFDFSLGNPSIPAPDSVKEAVFDIMFGHGISREGDLIDLAVKVDAVQKSGAWYAYKGEKIGQGRENAKTFLREHPEIMAEVEVQVREYYGLPADTVVETAVQATDTEEAKDKFDNLVTEE